MPQYSYYKTALIMTLKNIGYAAFIVSTIVVALYAAIVYGFLPLGSHLHPQMTRNYNLNPVAVYIHVFGAAIALLLSPLQLSSVIRKKYIAIHRWSGRLYLLAGVVLGGVSGLYIAQFAFGGFLSRSGFSVLALLWMATAVMAIAAIRRKDIRRHREWMIRNVALTFAAVTLRIYLGLFFAAGVAFDTFYPWLGWMCWVPNILIVEYFLRREKRVPSNTAPT